MKLGQFFDSSSSHERHWYLKSKHWKKLRLRKLQSVSFHCQHCGEIGKEKNNDVHHEQYKNLIDVELSDLIVLCQHCHMLHEARTGHRKIQRSKYKRLSIEQVNRVRKNLWKR